MKYIRTKNGIYNTENSKRISNVKACLIDNVIIYDNEVTSQADTIKELLSRFVLKGTDIILLNKEHTQYRFEGSNEWFDITDTELRMGIYGAIWTDKGLIYVAKLNDKKEFELL